MDTPKDIRTLTQSEWNIMQHMFAWCGGLPEQRSVMVFHYAELLRDEVAARTNKDFEELT